MEGLQIFYQWGAIVLLIAVLIYLEKQRRKFNSIIFKLKQMATTLDQVLQSVTENSSLDDSIIALLQGIKTQLDEALSGANLPAGVQAKVDAIFTASEASKEKVAAAIVANTPAEPEG